MRHAAIQRWLVQVAWVLLVLPLVASCAVAKSRSSWTDVSRIVAVGDVHGDYDQFFKVLRSAELIDNDGDWIGGNTHLVQMGDVVDRGPDSRKAMDLLMKLEKQARKKRGRVHALIGNHEAMNMIGDLRYVHPGEYAAFADRRSKSRQDDYYERVVAHIKKTTAEEQWPLFDDAYEQAFRKQHPLGFVEHLKAWSPKGKYGRWVLSHSAVVKINETLFVHGGLSNVNAELTLDEINAQVRDELSNAQQVQPDALIRSADGPLWYRGLAQNDDELDVEQQRVTEMLATRQAKRIVVAHTPLTGALIPRFDARVITVDVGMAAYYGSRVACLVIEGDQLYALHRGTRVNLPKTDEGVEAYLRQVAELDPSPSPVLEYLESLKAVPAEVDVN